MEIVLSLGEKLRALRVKRGDSLQDVADAIGASKAHVWELETGRSKNPSIDLLGRLAGHYEVSTALLVSEDGADDEETAAAMVAELAKHQGTLRSPNTRCVSAALPRVCSGTRLASSHPPTPRNLLHAPAR